MSVLPLRPAEFASAVSELGVRAKMTTVLAIFLIGLGVAEFLNNKKIARVFDPDGGDLRSTARQNVLGIGLVFLVSGLVLLLLP
jgi:hypothetical protein